MCVLLKAASRGLLPLTLVLATASTGHADPITPYSSATNFFIQPFDDGTLQGSFTIGQVPNGETFVAGPLLFDPIPALQYDFGQTVNFSRRFYTDGPQVGSRSVPGTNGREFESVFFMADFQITTGNATLPSEMPFPGWWSLEGVPTAWSGSLTFAHDASFSEPQFSGRISGTGIAGLFFALPVQQGGPLTLGQIVYGGDPTAPIPEPTTAVLVLTGVVAATSARRVSQWARHYHVKGTTRPPHDRDELARPSRQTPRS